MFAGDEDKDGYPDYLDDDSDGVSNFAELSAGSDPLVSGIVEAPTYSEMW